MRLKTRGIAIGDARLIIIDGTNHRSREVHRARLRGHNYNLKSARLPCNGDPSGDSDRLVRDSNVQTHANTLEISLVCGGGEGQLYVTDTCHIRIRDLLCM